MPSLLSSLIRNQSNHSVTYRDFRRRIPKIIPFHFSSFLCSNKCSAVRILHVQQILDIISVSNIDSGFRFFQQARTHNWRTVCTTPAMHTVWCTQVQFVNGSIELLHTVSIDFKEHDHNKIIAISPCVEYQSYLLHNEHELGDIVQVEIGPSSPVGGVDPVRTYDT